MGWNCGITACSKTKLGAFNRREERVTGLKKTGTSDRDCCSCASPSRLFSPKCMRLRGRECPWSAIILGAFSLKGARQIYCSWFYVNLFNLPPQRMRLWDGDFLINFRAALLRNGGRRQRRGTSGGLPPTQNSFTNRHTDSRFSYIIRGRLYTRGR